VRFVLAGAGHVGRTLLDILAERDPLLRERYGVHFRCVGVADSGGAAHAPGGLPLRALAELKRARRSVAELGTHGLGALALLDAVEADLLFEATPSPAHVGPGGVRGGGGEPGLSLARAALGRGMPVVMASKGPLVEGGFAELAALSDWGAPGGPALRFSGAVCGAMPTVNVGWRDLAAARITRVEGALNLTTQLLLSRMLAGAPYPEALAEAQGAGVAEPDPTLDVEGWDAASKLVILANAALGVPARLSQVTVEGMRGVGPELLARARASGGRVSLLATAEPDAERYRLAVRPEVLPADHPLGRLGAREMGVVFRTDLYGTVTVVSGEQGPGGASAAMLRDALSLLR
jgi:homoserine dehydrogenase